MQRSCCARPDTVTALVHNIRTNLMEQLLLVCAYDCTVDADSSVSHSSYPPCTQHLTAHCSANAGLLVPYIRTEDSRRGDPSANAEILLRAPGHCPSTRKQYKNTSDAAVISSTRICFYYLSYPPCRQHLTGHCSANADLLRPSANADLPLQNTQRTA